MKCKTCDQELPSNYLDKKAKQKSDRIKLARKLAKDRGEQVGAERKYNYVGIRRCREAGMSLRAIAKVFNCSLSPIVNALKEQT